MLAITLSKKMFFASGAWKTKAGDSVGPDDREGVGFAERLDDPRHVVQRLGLVRLRLVAHRDVEREADGHDSGRDAAEDEPVLGGPVDGSAEDRDGVLQRDRSDAGRAVVRGRLRRRRGRLLLDDGGRSVLTGSESDVGDAALVRLRLGPGRADPQEKHDDRGRSGAESHWGACWMSWITRSVTQPTEGSPRVERISPIAGAEAFPIEPRA